MIQKEPAKQRGFMRVTFELPSNIWAERVNLVGEFNDWDTTATPMSRHRSDSNWKVSVELKAGQRYRFRYLVDGKEWPYDSYTAMVGATIHQIGLGFKPFFRCEGRYSTWKRPPRTRSWSMKSSGPL